MKLVSLLLLAFAALAGQSAARPSSPLADTCGYQSCPQGKEGFINVHLVPHTHDDVGWLKTVDQYYYGARNNIQQAGVQYIIDSVVEQLLVSPDRRFIYVEMAFFWQWWQEQTEETRDSVRDLVSAGRLEFINGGWCMNDEATTHYVDIIDQMSLGLNKLNETFGECGRPRISWQIDPFGHSREQAFIFSQMGYDGLFFGRLDAQDKQNRMDTKTMEMVWSGSNSIQGNEGSLFTGANFNLYQAPSGFCFDVLCDDEPIIDDTKSKDYNVEKRVTDFLNYCQRQSDIYNTDNIMLTMGGDFTYQDANMWFKNMDKLIKYANERQATGSRFNLFYSTPSCYVKALNDLGRSWPSKTDDFFPYGSDPHSYWTGYFTSRPSLKYMVRQASNLLQSCKQAASILSLEGGENGGDVEVMKEAMGVMQHHDAVAGTEKQHVAEDYARLLHKGVVECQKTLNSFHSNELPLGGDALPEVSFCQLNVSACDVTEMNSRFVVIVQNSLARSVDKYVRVPVPDVTAGVTYSVLDPEGKPVLAQLVPIPDYVKDLPDRPNKSTATMELVFLASQLPPLGSKSYHVGKTTLKKSHTFKSRAKLHSRRPAFVGNFTISNGKINVTVDETSHLLKLITVDGKSFPIKQEFLWYHGFLGNNEVAENRSSGAYIFRPKDSTALPVTDTPPTIDVQTGPLVQEIRQVFGDWVGQTIRLYAGQEHVELDWVVGPIPVLDGMGKEIISRVTTAVPNKGIFYTDSNARQSIKREVDKRETYPYTVTEPVAANYYPINSHIFISDDSGQQMSILVDRSQGGASLRDGELELMVHRRLLHDDAFGVGEPINETAFLRGLIVRGTHLLIPAEVTQSARKIRTLSQEIYRQPEVSFVATTLSAAEWAAKYKTQNQFISDALPENVNLLTMEEHTDGTYLVRLEHMYDVGEDATLSQDATVTLDELFPDFDITWCEEAMLGGNQFTKDSSRLQWEVAGVAGTKSDNVQTVNSKAISVVLKPMQIRTFVLKLAKKANI